MSSSEKTARINARELAERIVALAKIRGISLRELARRSEFENEGHVGTLVSRGRKNPDYGPDVNILRKIAKGGQVHFEWLISGEGERDLPGDVDAPPLTFPWTGAERRIGDAVRASFDPQRHRPSDTHVLKIMLVAMGLPLAVLDQPTLASLVRVWLDAAARTRVFGPATIVTYTLGLEAVDARRVAADYWSRMKHLDRLAAQMEDLFDDVTDPAASLGENDRARARLIEKGSDLVKDMVQELMGYGPQPEYARPPQFDPAAAAELEDELNDLFGPDARLVEPTKAPSRRAG